MKWIAKTLFGLENLLAEELESFGATDIEPITRAVAFEGDHLVMYRANLESRIALKILKPIFEFEAPNIDVYYRNLFEFPWPKEFGKAKTFAIRVTTSSETFYHSKFMTLKTKDAVVDHYTRFLGYRLNVDRDEPDVQVQVHIRDHHVSVYMDTSGDSLHYRGYRENKHSAPMNEVLAAGLIMLSGWNKSTPFYDGMCGSGTLITEAAWMAMDYAPGLHRDEFAFMKLPRFKESDWKRIRKKALDKVKPLDTMIFGSDSDRKAIGTTRKHLENAGVEGVETQVLDFFDLEASGRGHLMLNPPYGERLKERDIFDLYSRMGTHLKHGFPGFKVWMISSELSAMKHLGLRPFRKFTMYNGKLECQFQGFELFEGKWNERNETKKTPKVRKEKAPRKVEKAVEPSVKDDFEPPVKDDVVPPVENDVDPPVGGADKW